MDNNDLEENADLLNRERQRGVVLRYETQIDPNISQMRNSAQECETLMISSIK